MPGAVGSSLDASIIIVCYSQLFDNNMYFTKLKRIELGRPNYHMHI